MNDTHVLYRMFDHDGDLLYVGITNNPRGRILGHQTNKQWWTSVGNITLEHHTDRPALEAAEKVAVGSEQPRFNVALTMYSTVWCRAEGHVPPGTKKCEDCRELTEQAARQREAAEHDELLQQEYRSCPVILNLLGLQGMSA